ISLRSVALRGPVLQRAAEMAREREDLQWLQTAVFLQTAQDVTYGRVLDAGDLSLARDHDAIVVRHRDRLMPVSARSLTETFGTENPSDEALARVTSAPDDLHDLLELQHYRLAHWRTGGRELNYRRFFAINDLAALRVEDEEVFEAVHGFVLRLVRGGKVGGLRIDHIDGLLRPQEYLERVRRRAPDVYIVVEKILEHAEELPETWPVEGTTGYDFLNRVGGLFVDPAAEKPLTDFYAEFVGKRSGLAEVRREKKLRLMHDELAADVERLTDLFVLICELRRNYRDYTRHDLRQVLREVAAAFPVYRSYVDDKTGRVTPQDERVIDKAVDRARKVSAGIADELLDFLRDLLLLRYDGLPEHELAMRFQQLTGAVMAKGVEDTLFYTFNRFIPLNEVGGDPGSFGVSLGEFHLANARTQRAWPKTMLATSSHDTKRSEDVRARLSLLSEVPDRWTAAVLRWSEMNQKHRRGDAPDRNIEYLLYQTLVGAWPLEADRLIAFVVKAAKEAREHTSWIDPSPGYDDALRAFVEGTLADEEFVSDLQDFVRPLIDPGRVNSLAQTLLKLTSPGVPDIYQGCELWDLSLVDPDNRRPVNYGVRRALLRAIKDAEPGDVMARADEGAPKLYLIFHALKARADLSGSFGARGDYQPLTPDGSKADHVVAYLRGENVIAVAPRLVLALKAGWGDTTLVLPDGRWDDVLGSWSWSGTVRLDELLGRFPVALLLRRGPG
ncbi:MAG: malto-oligosyltrehalose synthase, partial [Actinomycetota bacterium]